MKTTRGEVAINKIYNFDDIIARRTCPNSMRDYISILFMCPSQCYSFHSVRKQEKTHSFCPHEHVVRANKSNFYDSYFMMGILESEKLKLTKQIHHADDWSVLFCCLGEHWTRQKEEKFAESFRVDKIFQLQKRRNEMKRENKLKNTFFSISIYRYQHSFSTVQSDRMLRQRHPSERFAPSAEWDRLLIWLSRDL